MIDLQDKSICPTLEQIAEVIGNSLFTEFCREIKDQYNVKEKIEYSICSMEPGWNIKFKKSGKALCTIYPRETYCDDGCGQKGKRAGGRDPAGFE